MLAVGIERRAFMPGPKRVRRMDAPSPANAGVITSKKDRVLNAERLLRRPLERANDLITPFKGVFERLGLVAASEYNCFLFI
jgi:hypothetical protein